MLVDTKIMTSSATVNLCEKVLTLRTHIKIFIVILFCSFYSLNLWANTTRHANDQARIIGGFNSSESYPWMVSVQTGGHFCGGALIGKDWVLTAAHCMEDVKAEQLNLYVGATDLTNLNNSEHHLVDWIAIHPDYSGDTFFSDIALLKLSKSSDKTPIPLLSQQANSELQANEQLRVMGWGLTDSSNMTSMSYDLKEVDVSFQSDDECQDTYPVNVSNYWDRSLCAGEPQGGKDACQGDSGGPLVVKANDEWALTGLVSWGDGCAEAKKYGAYSEVAFFQDWIEQRRRGVTLLGPEKIGFVGMDRTKPETYSVLNLGTTTAVIDNKYIEGRRDGLFEIDPVNWALLDDAIPPGYQCDFTVNALGRLAGEHNAEITLEIDGYTTSHALNSKVLNTISASQLDVDWQFFSGTNSNSEHSESWLPLTEQGVENDSLLISGAINEGERSVLLTYLNGSHGQESNILKFDYKVDSAVGLLLVYVNESLDSWLQLQDTNNGTGATWKTQSIELPEDINHVMFIYYRGGLFSSVENAAYLDNLRVCSDASLESSCSTAQGFYNTDIISRQDDPAANANWTSVCEQVVYDDSEISYAGRTDEDVVFSSTLGLSSSGGGSIGFLLMGGLLLLCRSQRKAQVI
jgi:secreted trypsin-like serine protease